MGYLKFFGKIKAEQIMNNGVDNAGTWIKARDYCLVNNSKGDSSGTYSAVVGQKTKDGHWTIGHLNDSNNNLEFVYTTDANYKTRNQ